VLSTPMLRRLWLTPLLLALACSTAGPPPTNVPTPTPAVLGPPVAARRPHQSELHGQTREDPYFWLRDRRDPAVLAHLKAENAWTEGVTGPLTAFRAKLAQEMLARIVEDDRGVPAPHGNFAYYSRTETGRAYPLHCRQPRGGGAEELLLDENQLGAEKSYFRVGDLAISPSDRLLAYSTDDRGDERYTLHFKELSSGRPLPEQILGIYYTVAWSADERFLFYTVVDAAQRPYQVRRHQVGTATTSDVVVHEEKDERFNVSVQLDRSGRWIVIHLESAITTEQRLIDAKKADGPALLVEARRDGVEYRIAPHGDRLYVLSNHQGPTFGLYEAPLKKPGRAQWKVVIPPHPEVTLNRLEAFADHLVIEERQAGLQQLRVRSLGKKPAEHRIALPEPSYELLPLANLEWKTQQFRFGYTSLITPLTVFDYDLNKRTRLEKKRLEVRGYDTSLYTTERITAQAADGTGIPISVVRKKDRPLDGTAPLFLHGYGAYGLPYDPAFDSYYLSLLDRGVTVAIAHVRGGGELGRPWKDAGKLEKKMNTFTDFIACAEHLIAQKYTAADRLGITGRSAGGLLIGAVLNLRPELFKVAVAGVPFVDVINSMLDASIPLTAIEWEEWGNPARPADFAWMSAYSPYDNVKAQAYPALYVHAGLNDTRVGYWEPAKWVAKLRATKLDHNPLILRINLDAGHGGASGRYGELEDVAFEYAFVLDQLGAR
jgi:oligopeptidase B